MKRILRKSFLLVLGCSAVFIVGCASVFIAGSSSVFNPGSSSVERQPATASAEFPLKALAHHGVEVVTDAAYNANTCGGVLNELSQSLQSTDDWSAYSNDLLKTEGAATIEALWQLRLALHQRLPDISANCAATVRDLFHRLREDEDYLGEFAYHEPALDPSKLKFQDQAVPIYNRTSYPPYQVRKDVDDPQFEFKAGDLMMARGVSFTSAIISQITSNRSQFSHVVFVNVDEKTKVPNTVESYIGAGVATYEINFALKNENARLVLLRPKDSALGARAAGYAMQAAAAHIPYDYDMNFRDYSKMSCVAVSVYGYDKASNHQIMVPEYPAQLNLNSPSFLSELHLKNGELITPDDLETDPRFELVLDWRDYRLTRDSREKDAVLAEMVRWINDLGYKFRSTGKSLIATDVLRPSLGTPIWPILKAVTKAPNLDPKLPKDTLSMMTVMGQVAGNIAKNLREVDLAYFEANQRPMTGAQLRVEVEKMRVADLAQYKENGSSAIHSALRPDSLKFSIFKRNGAH